MVRATKPADTPPSDHDDEEHQSRGKRVFGQTIYVNAFERGTRGKSPRKELARPERIEVRLCPQENSRGRMKYHRTRSIPELCRITLKPRLEGAAAREEMEEVYISQYTHSFGGEIEKPHLVAWKQDYVTLHRVMHRDSKMCIMNSPIGSRAKYRHPKRPKSAPPGSLEFDFDKMEPQEPLSRRSTSPGMLADNWMDLDDVSYGYGWTPLHSGNLTEGDVSGSEEAASETGEEDNDNKRLLGNEELREPVREEISKATCDRSAVLSEAWQNLETEYGMRQPVQEEVTSQVTSYEQSMSAVDDIFDSWYGETMGYHEESGERLGRQEVVRAEKMAWSSEGAWGDLDEIFSEQQEEGYVESNCEQEGEMVVGKTEEWKNALRVMDDIFGEQEEVNELDSDEDELFVEMKEELEKTYDEQKNVEDDNEAVNGEVESEEDEDKMLDGKIGELEDDERSVEERELKRDYVKGEDEMFRGKRRRLENNKYVEKKNNKEDVGEEMSSDYEDDEMFDGTEALKEEWPNRHGLHVMDEIFGEQDGESMSDDDDEDNEDRSAEKKSDDDEDETVDGKKGELENDNDGEEVEQRRLINENDVKQTRVIRSWILVDNTLNTDTVNIAQQPGATVPQESVQRSHLLNQNTSPEIAPLDNNPRSTQSDEISNTAEMHEDADSEDDLTQQARTLISSLRCSVKTPENFRKTILHTIHTPKPMKARPVVLQQNSDTRKDYSQLKDIDDKQQPKEELSHEQVPRRKIPQEQSPRQQTPEEYLPRGHSLDSQRDGDGTKAWELTRDGSDESEAKTPKSPKQQRTASPEKGLDERLRDLIGDLGPNEDASAFTVTSSAQQSTAVHRGSKKNKVGYVATPLTLLHAIPYHARKNGNMLQKTTILDGVQLTSTKDDITIGDKMRSYHKIESSSFSGRPSKPERKSVTTLPRSHSPTDQSGDNVEGGQSLNKPDGGGSGEDLDEITKKQQPEPEVLVENPPITEKTQRYIQPKSNSATPSHGDVTSVKKTDLNSRPNSYSATLSQGETTSVKKPNRHSQPSRSKTNTAIIHRTPSLGSDASYKRRLTFAWIEQQRKNTLDRKEQRLRRTKSAEFPSAEFSWLNDEPEVVKLKYSKSEASYDQLNEMYDLVDERPGRHPARVSNTTEPSAITKARSLEHKLHHQHKPTSLPDTTPKRPAEPPATTITAQMVVEDTQAAQPQDSQPLKAKEKNPNSKSTIEPHYASPRSNQPRSPGMNQSVLPSASPLTTVQRKQIEKSVIENDGRSRDGMMKVVSREALYEKMNQNVVSSSNVYEDMTINSSTNNGAEIEKQAWPSSHVYQDRTTKQPSTSTQREQAPSWNIYKDMTTTKKSVNNTPIEKESPPSNHYEDLPSELQSTMSEPTKGQYYATYVHKKPVMKGELKHTNDDNHTVLSKELQQPSLSSQQIKDGDEKHIEESMTRKHDYENIDELSKGSGSLAKQKDIKDGVKRTEETKHDYKNIEELCKEPTSLTGQRNDGVKSCEETKHNYENIETLVRVKSSVVREPLTKLRAQSQGDENKPLVTKIQAQSKENQRINTKLPAQGEEREQTACKIHVQNQQHQPLTKILAKNPENDPIVTKISAQSQQKQQIFTQLPAQRLGTINIPFQDEKNQATPDNHQPTITREHHTDQVVTAAHVITNNDKPIEKHTAHYVIKPQHRSSVRHISTEALDLHDNMTSATEVTTSNTVPVSPTSGERKKRGGKVGMILSSIGFPKLRKTKSEPNLQNEPMFPELEENEKNIERNRDGSKHIHVSENNMRTSENTPNYDRALSEDTGKNIRVSSEDTPKNVREFPEDRPTENHKKSFKVGSFYPKFKKFKHKFTKHHRSMEGSNFCETYDREDCGCDGKMSKGGEGGGKFGVSQDMEDGSMNRDIGDKGVRKPSSPRNEVKRDMYQTKHHIGKNKVSPEIEASSSRQKVVGVTASVQAEQEIEASSSRQKVVGVTASGQAEQTGTTGVVRATTVRDTRGDMEYKDDTTVKVKRSDERTTVGDEQRKQDEGQNENTNIVVATTYNTDRNEAYRDKDGGKHDLRRPERSEQKEDSLSFVSLPPLEQNVAVVAGTSEILAGTSYHGDKAADHGGRVSYPLEDHVVNDGGRVSYPREDHVVNDTAGHETTAGATHITTKYTPQDRVVKAKITTINATNGYTLTADSGKTCDLGSDSSERRGTEEGRVDGEQERRLKKEVAGQVEGMERNGTNQGEVTELEGQVEKKGTSDEHKAHEFGSKIKGFISKVKSPFHHQKEKHSKKNLANFGDKSNDLSNTVRTETVDNISREKTDDGEDNVSSIRSIDEQLTILKDVAPSKVEQDSVVGDDLSTEYMAKRSELRDTYVDKASERSALVKDGGHIASLRSTKYADKARDTAVLTEGGGHSSFWNAKYVGETTLVKDGGHMQQGTKSGVVTAFIIGDTKDKSKTAALNENDCKVVDYDFAARTVNGDRKLGTIGREGEKQQASTVHVCTAATRPKTKDGAIKNGDDSVITETKAEQTNTAIDLGFLYDDDNVFLPAKGTKDVFSGKQTAEQQDNFPSEVKSSVNIDSENTTRWTSQDVLQVRKMKDVRNGGANLRDGIVPDLPSKQVKTTGDGVRNGGANLRDGTVPDLPSKRVKTTGDGVRNGGANLRNGTVPDLPSKRVKTTGDGVRNGAANLRDEMVPDLPSKRVKTTGDGVQNDLTIRHHGSYNEMNTSESDKRGVPASAVSEGERKRALKYIEKVTVSRNMEPKNVRRGRRKKTGDEHKEENENKRTGASDVTRATEQGKGIGTNQEKETNQRIDQNESRMSDNSHVRKKQDQDRHVVSSGVRGEQKSGVEQLVTRKGAWLGPKGRRKSDEWGGLSTTSDNDTFTSDSIKDTSEDELLQLIEDEMLIGSGDETSQDSLHHYNKRKEDETSSFLEFEGGDETSTGHNSPSKVVKQQEVMSEGEPFLERENGEDRSRTSTLTGGHYSPNRGMKQELAMFNDKTFLKMESGEDRSRASTLTGGHYSPSQVNKQQEMMSETSQMDTNNTLPSVTTPQKQNGAIDHPEVTRESETAEERRRSSEDVWKTTFRSGVTITSTSGKKSPTGVTSTTGLLRRKSGLKTPPPSWTELELLKSKGENQPKQGIPDRVALKTQEGSHERTMSLPVAQGRVALKSGHHVRTMSQPAAIQDMATMKTQGGHHVRTVAQLNESMMGMDLAGDRRISGWKPASRQNSYTNLDQSMVAGSGPVEKESGVVHNQLGPPVFRRANALKRGNSRDARKSIEDEMTLRNYHVRTRSEPVKRSVESGIQSEKILKGENTKHIRSSSEIMKRRVEPILRKNTNKTKSQEIKKRHSQDSDDDLATRIKRLLAEDGDGDDPKHDVTTRPGYRAKLSRDKTTYASLPTGKHRSNEGPARKQRDTQQSRRYSAEEDWAKTL